SRLEKTRQPELALSGDIAATLTSIRESVPADPKSTSAWVNRLRVIENEKRAEEQEMLDDSRSPLHPMRVYHELGDFLDRDAIVVGDGGDFVSFAGRVWETWEPGTWMDPGPYGCLGAGPGQAIGAKLAHPERQVCLLLGDGAFGFSGMEFDTMARHGLPIVAVMGNNGIWALEHHPMKFLYGYSLAAELRPETRYDEVVSALGCHGHLVRTPGELRPALGRASASGKPALVNVLTDPEVVYPRRANLACWKLGARSARRKPVRSASRSGSTGTARPSTSSSSASGWRSSSSTAPTIRRRTSPTMTRWSPARSPGRT